ncbi:hypothetical protein PENTCL1PPCAC_19837, partial [Pristionchus entomophagus]
SFLFDLSKTCKFINLAEESFDDGYENVSVDAIQKICNNMLEGTIKLRKLWMAVTKNWGIEFLKLMEINYRDGWLYSDRHIEAYKIIVDEEDDQNSDLIDNAFVIFNGNLEIHISLNILCDFVSDITLTMFDTQELLEKAKDDENYVRIDLPSN